MGEWNWYDNPFIGSRPFGALVAINLLLKNWDLKTANNKLYVVSGEDGRQERRYVVRDLGASLGHARQPRFLSWFPFMRHRQGSKNNLEDFEAQGFITSVDDDGVDFDYQGVNRGLLDSVTAADVRWTCDLLARLSERQWMDAFRAGGYTPAESSRYLRKIQDNISRARTLADAHSLRPAS